MKKGLFLILLCQSAFAQNYKIHVLKEGETLSEILWNNGYTPLYGEKNWVDKTLKMNHLKSVNAKELRKGFPVILPSKEENKKPTTITKYKTINKMNYINKESSYISKHQDLFFNAGVVSEIAEVSEKVVNNSESVNLSFSVIGKNNYRLSNLIYNFEGELSYINSRTAKYDDTNDIKLKPTYALRTSMRISKPSLPIDFGPTYKLEEISHVDLDDKLTARRDQNHWLGFKINRDQKIFDRLIHFTALYEKNIIQTSITDDKRYEASRFNLSSKSKITNNVYSGASLSWINYDGTNLESSNQFVLNLSYKIQ